mmetsp:Transcript_6645/g.27104  ORF Transcript_6645/g.27104 Transcript_6645/m.27104 type:complete len:268 (-) Transcript_6645:116-919(-)
MHKPDRAQRQRRAEAPFPAAPAHRRGRGRALNVRAQRRQRRGGHEGDRHSQGGPLRPQRHQNVVHERPDRGDRGALRQDRPEREDQGDYCIHCRRSEHAGLPDCSEARQDGHAGVGYVRTRARGCHRAGGEQARRGGPGRVCSHERPRSGACGALGRARGHNAGVHGRGAALHARAVAVRPAHWQLPAHAGKGRGHVHVARGRACARLPGGQGVRRRHARQGRLCRSHLVRLGHGIQRCARSCPGSRRQRVHQGLPGGALPARRQAL